MIKFLKNQRSHLICKEMCSATLRSLKSQIKALRKYRIKRGMESEQKCLILNKAGLCGKRLEPARFSTLGGQKIVQSTTHLRNRGWQVWIKMRIEFVIKIISWNKKVSLNIEFPRQWFLTHRPYRIGFVLLTIWCASIYNHHWTLFYSYCMKLSCW